MWGFDGSEIKSYLTTAKKASSDFSFFPEVILECL